MYKINKISSLNCRHEGKPNNRPHSIRDGVKNFIRKHISSFPAVDSHYVRENTKKKYLENNFSISKIHKLYFEWILDEPSTSNTCHDNKINAFLRQFTDIFSLSFFKPKRDQCDACEIYRNI